MKQLVLSILALSLVLLGCSNNQKKEGFTSDNNRNATSKKLQSCLAEHAYEPCNLLSAMDVAKLTDMKLSEIEQTGPADFKDPLMRYCNFTWPSDRTLTVKTSAITIDAPVDNRVSVGGFKLLDEKEIKSDYKEWFDNFYKEMTPEQKAEFKKRMNEELEKESEEVKSTAGSLMNMMPKSKYQSVQGLGDRATLESNSKTPEARLHILSDNVIFTVLVEISEDFELNGKMAREIGALILDFC